LNRHKEMEVNMKEKFTGTLGGMGREATGESILSIFYSVVKSCHYNKEVHQ